MLAFIKVA